MNPLCFVGQAILPAGRLSSRPVPGRAILTSRPESRQQPRLAAPLRIRKAP